MKIISYTLSCIFALMLVACSEQANLVVLNRSGRDLSLVAVDGTTQALLAGSTETIKYPANGKSLLIRIGPQSFKIAFSKFPPREFRSSSYPYAVTVALRQDLKVVVCYPDGRDIEKQPDGYPVVLEPIQ